MRVFCIIGQGAGNPQQVDQALPRIGQMKLFQENNLGSIQAGKFADLLVLDRDYLTVPADQIKDIKPVITMVGGRIVQDAGAFTSTQ